MLITNVLSLLCIDHLIVTVIFIKPKVYHDNERIDKRNNKRKNNRIPTPETIPPGCRNIKKK